MTNKSYVRSYVRRDGTRVRAHVRRNSGRSTTAPTQKRFANYQPAMRQPTMRRVNAEVNLMAQQVATVYRFAQAGWGSEARTRLIAHVGQDAWATIERRWRAPQCTELANLAAQCDRLASMDRPPSDWSKLTGQRAFMLLLRGLDPMVSQQLHQAAMLLRIAGVAACVARGRSPLDCACAKAICISAGGSAELAISSMRTVLNTVVPLH
jgi:hypothetical protein